MRAGGASRDDRLGMRAFLKGLTLSLSKGEADYILASVGIG